MGEFIMGKPKMVTQYTVPEEWIDYNGHMNDAEYVRAISWSVDALMESIGITEEFHKQHQYTMYTLENHVCYLDEMKLGERFEVYMHILDYDQKRIHAFFELYGENKKRAATSEQMLMGIDVSTGRPQPFPEALYTKIKTLATLHTPDEKPKEAGRVIGIRRK